MTGALKLPNFSSHSVTFSGHFSAAVEIIARLISLMFHRITVVVFFVA